ncbi:MAG: hypothetical protein HZB29_12555 [Nitrospinae bacterium]|nr:hypothetical protein [Nitrospinota bacterium]
MVDSIGMQQVLQLSNTVERVQQAQQGVTADVAHSFAREVEKTTAVQRNQTHAATEAEEPGIRDNDQRKRKHYARRMPERKAKEEEAGEKQAPPAETGHGTVINIVA